MNSQDKTIGCMVVQSVWIGRLLPPNGCYLPSRAFSSCMSAIETSLIIPGKRQVDVSRRIS